MKIINKLALSFVILFSVALATPFSITFTSVSDFSSGELHNIIVEPDPVFPDGALALIEADTIRVLQVFPAGHCIDCIDRTVDSLSHFGTPPLNFDIEVTTIDVWNEIDSLGDSFQAADPISLDLFERNLHQYDIIFFGIANGYGEESNDLSNSGKRMVRQFAGLGRGIVLTHDTIAKREGPFGSHSIGTFIHENFNDIDDVTGLDAEWVSQLEPYNLYYHVERLSSAPVDASILNYPFELPTEFDITACHEFGEHYSSGQVWFAGPDDQIYMHSYYSPEYGSYASYFSTGHAEEWHGSSFRPAEWEGKAMINAMYYSYFGGLGSGVYTSSVFAAPCPGGLYEMSCDVDTAGGSSVTIELASSIDGVLWSPWFIITSGGVIPPIAAEGPFYRYKVYMSRSLTSDPLLHSISFNFDLPSPELELISPPVSSFYSCSCGVITWQVHSESPIEIASAYIDVNSVIFGPSRCAYSAIDSTFEFLGPDSCWKHGVTYYGLIDVLTEESGCPRTGDTTFVFTSDLRPPVFSMLSPSPGEIIGDDTPIIIATVFDSTSGIENSLFKWVIEGDTVHWSETGLSWNGTTRRLSYTTSAIGLSLSGVVEVCAIAGDNAIGCGANMADTCWSFYVDNIGPQAELISPHNGFLSCDSFSAVFILSDTMNIDLGTIVLSIGSDTLFYPESMEFFAGTLYVFTDILTTDGDTILVRFERIEDLLGNNSAPLDFQIIIDKSPPYVWDKIPSDSAYVGLSAPQISFRLSDSLSGIDEDSIAIFVDGIEYSIYDGVWDGELLILDGSSLGWDFEHNDSITVCLRAVDLASVCGQNAMEECWFFRVNLLGPQCYIVGPPESSIVGCDSFAICFILDDPNGLNYSTLSFTVNEILYTIDSPEVSISFDTVSFVSSWSHSDVVTVRIVSAEDSLGNILDMPCEWSFQVDLLPPNFEYISPSNAGVVDTAQPVITAVITDPSGITNSSIEFCAAGDCWDFYDTPSPFSFIGDTLVFNPILIHHFFDEESVFVSIHACDSTVWCGPNCSDTSWFFWIDKFGPHANLIEPDRGVYSSCPDQGFMANLFDPSGMIMDSIELAVNDVPYRWPNSALFYNADTLAFAPSIDWNHLDTLVFELYSAYDSLGNPLQDTILTQVIIDLEPPELQIIQPFPGTNNALPQCTVKVVLRDDGCGVDFESAIFHAGGELIAFGEQLGISDDSLIFTPSSFHFDERETAFVEITVSDCAEYCGANELDTVWNFFVPDDDTILPFWVDYTPTVWIEDSVFILSCRAVDGSGIFTQTALSQFRPFIVWDDDGELAASCETLSLSLNSTFADTFVFETEDYLISHGEEIILRASCWDADFDFSVMEDPKRSDSPEWTVSVLEPANIELTFPIPGSITSCRDQVLHFSIFGESSLNYRSCEFEIAGEIYTLDSVELSIQGDSVFVFDPIGDFFTEGQVSVRLVSASDQLGNPLHTPIEWLIVVDDSPPVLTLIEPFEGEMLDSTDVDCEIDIYDLFTPINDNSIYLTLFLDNDSTIFTTEHSALGWNSESGQLTFLPHDANMFFQSADSVMIKVCAEDFPDFCEPHCGCIFFSFWIEPEIECSTTTDPFTPNLDGYNDEVGIMWPGFYRDPARIEIFDMRGKSVVNFIASAGKVEGAVWDGLDSNGRKCSSGVYIYIISVGSKRVCRGTITLAR
ncbi:gliding motility-associated C-terminal domain-containing protein [bacterium]|nr:gliding motility-associated C-terminal domain-containing protein [bacterium]